MCIAAAAGVSMLLRYVVAARRLTPGGAVIGAAISVLAVFVVSVVAGWIAFTVFQPKLRADPWAVSLRLACVGVWFGPLLIMSLQGYIWSVVGAGIIAAGTGRVLGNFACVIVGLPDNGDETYALQAGMFDGLSSDSTSPRKLGAYSAATLMHLGVAAAVDQRSIAAALSFSFGCFLVGWLTRPAFDGNDFGSLSRPSTIGIVLSLVLAIAVNAIALVTLHPSRAMLRADNTEQGGSISAAAAADLHSGVVLLSERPQHAILVAPQPQKSQIAHRTNSVNPISFPFSGEYWFYRWSLPRPPKSALVQTGSPLSDVFSNVDRQPLAMVARQVLDSPIKLACCSRIDVDVSSTDKQQDALSMELILMSTQLREKPQTQSLGALQLTSDRGPVTRDDTIPVKERLRFHLPKRPAIREFDEIRIVFHLGVPRAHRSANVAIDRFYLVPRDY